MDIFSLIKPYRKAIVFAWALMLMELVVELTAPILMANIIDEGILSGDMKAIVFWGVILLSASLLAFGCGIANSFLSAHAAQSFGYDLRKEAFFNIQKLPYSKINGIPAPSLITRLTNDVTQIQNMLFMVLRIALRAPLMVIFGTIASFMIDVELAIIFAIVVPFLVVFIIWALKRATKFFQKIQKILDRLNGKMRDTLSGIRIVKAFYNKGYEERNFTRTNLELRNTTTKSLQFIEMTVPLLLLLMNLSIILVIWLSTGRISGGSTKAGEVVAIVNYGTRISHALSMLTWIIMAFSRAKASYERVKEIFQFEEEIGLEEKNEKANFKCDVKFAEVSFSYNGNRKVLSDIDFCVKAGQRVAILGATGSGKTSLVQLLPRLFEPTEGEIFLDGVPLNHYSIGSIRKMIGYVPQEAFLFTGTIKENIAWGNRNASMDTIVQAAKDAQIHETILRFPKGYDTIIGQKGVNLSGGQKQRLAIARALVRKPKILIFDDSTSALDLETEEKLLHALLSYEATMFIITQKISTAKKMDMILLLDEGTLVAKGSYDEVYEKSELFRRLVTSQEEGVLLDANAAK